MLAGILSAREGGSSWPLAAPVNAIGANKYDLFSPKFTDRTANENYSHTMNASASHTDHAPHFVGGTRRLSKPLIHLIGLVRGILFFFSFPLFCTGPSASAVFAD